MSISIYYSPKCMATISPLQDKEIDPELILYLDSRVIVEQAVC